MILLVLSFGLNPNTLKIANPVPSFLFLPGCIATVVGILDEVNQIYIPYRDASITDVILDLVGILLVGILFHLNQQGRKNEWEHTKRNYSRKKSIPLEV
jgi:VanZ family protein